MSLKNLCFIALIPFFGDGLVAQNLKPGFDKGEYIEMLCVNANHTNPDHFANIPDPERFTLDYRSPIVALDNAWELWTSKDNMAVISLRGTTENTVSWLANFYAAMVPAKGTLQLGNDDVFNYTLAENPSAAVHVGWLVATAYLSKTVLPKIDSIYKAGIKDIYIVGHSQGGAIAFLMTAYLYHLQLQGSIPADVRFKTYCSAGPKPGNLFFAYEYEALTQEGWAYNVVNANDWVPEVPFSVQTTSDFTEVNPFRYAKGTIKQQKFPKNIALKHVYNKLDKPSRKAQKNYQKYLGDLMSNYVVNNIPDFTPPAYVESNNYVRTGNTIVLQGDADYYAKFPLDKEKLFQHHMFDAYLFLALRLQDDNTNKEPILEQPKLNGNWELIYITGKKIAFDGLYPDKKPQITFDLHGRTVSGFSSCNGFGGQLDIEDNALLITNVNSTLMACPGEGEASFFTALGKVNSFVIDDNGILELKEGDILQMRFKKIN